MNSPGVAKPEDLLVTAREVLLDALDALSEQTDAVIVIGAQAVYLRTGRVSVALAEATKDSDLALDPRALEDDPLVEAAMKAAGFRRNPQDPQPGSWVNRMGVPVDLMVPEALAGPGGRRGARIPPHDKGATRRARGLEAAVVDNSIETVASLRQSSTRSCQVRVAGTGALLVAKMHKVAERLDSPDRLEDKDAHDMYRIFAATETAELAITFRELLDDAISAETTGESLDMIAALIASGPQAPVAAMAGRAETGIGDPLQVATACSILAADLLHSLGT